MVYWAIKSYISQRTHELHAWAFLFKKLLHTESIFKNCERYVFYASFQITFQHLGFWVISPHTAHAFILLFFIIQSMLLGRLEKKIKEKNCRQLRSWGFILIAVVLNQTQLPKICCTGYEIIYDVSWEQIWVAHIRRNHFK